MLKQYFLHIAGDVIQSILWAVYILLCFSGGYWGQTPNPEVPVIKKDNSTLSRLNKNEPESIVLIKAQYRDRGIINSGLRLLVAMGATDVFLTRDAAFICKRTEMSLMPSIHSTSKELLSMVQLELTDHTNIFSFSINITLFTTWNFTFSQYYIITVVYIPPLTKC